MEIGNIIRRYRKEKNLTQEEIVRYLGVSAPAVNKWERGNSLPDIMLLAPIARLLDVSPDIPFPFQKEPSDEETFGYLKDNEEWKELPGSKESLFVSPVSE